MNFQAPSPNVQTNSKLSEAEKPRKSASQAFLIWDFPKARDSVPYSSIAYRLSLL